MNTILHIAIDGPVASGKGTIAAMLAKRLGVVYIYTGAMYRALALACLRSGIDLADTDKVLEVLNKSQITMEEPSKESVRSFTVRLNGEDVSDVIGTPEVAKATPLVAAISQVRQHMVALQQQMAAKVSVVMEGRDIGLRVLPDAELKIYLTATVEERARRRFSEWQKKGIQKTFDDVLADTKKRDEQDTVRAADPLQKLPDAWELDTTGMSQDQVIEAIIQELQKRGGI